MPGGVSPRTSLGPSRLRGEAESGASECLSGHPVGVSGCLAVTSPTLRAGSEGLRCDVLLTPDEGRAWERTSCASRRPVPLRALGDFRGVHPGSRRLPSMPPPVRPALRLTAARRSGWARTRDRLPGLPLGLLVLSRLSIPAASVPLFGVRLVGSCGVRREDGAYVVVCQARAPLEPTRALGAVASKVL